MLYTNSADDKDLGSPAIAVPSVQLLLTRQSSVLPRVLGSASVGRSVGMRLHDRAVRGRVFIVSLKGWSGRLKGSFGVGEETLRSRGSGRLFDTGDLDVDRV